MARKKALIVDDSTKDMCVESVNVTLEEGAEMFVKATEGVESPSDDEARFPKPTEEEIKEYEEALKEAYEEYEKMPDYTLCQGPRALEVAKMSIEYNNNLYNWKNDEWKGVIMYNTTMSPIIQELTNGNVDSFTIDKNNLQWLYYILTNVSGRGLEAAVSFSDHEDVFVELVESVCEAMEKFKDVVENLRFLQDRVAAAYQGFYLRQDGIIEGDASDEV